ncbi:hypothetical protein HDA40_000703 [Hamadaea flava]|uniref:Uncharacterized protein n=1 Tax=Hamadaea flava TaxID=1742688 RepID=A0ABV8M069_9ACTN|nr:hypothetical protein [Hamadaea flava]MCP2322196.1 hypothetical protein [Hamadaea flava]
MSEPEAPAERKPWSPVLAGAVALVGVAALCCWGALSQFSPSIRSDDPREYPRKDEALHITYGGGDLEDDLLPRYSVKLPCDVQHLRWGNHEDMGSMGSLYLRFDTSPTCLDEFLRDNRLQSAAAWTPAVFVPAEYGWAVSSSDAAYAASPSERVQLSVSIHRGEQRPEAYVVAVYR